MVVHGRDAAAAGGLAEVVPRSERLALIESTGSLARLAEIALSAHGTVILARLGAGAAELAELLAHCEGMPVVVLVRRARELALPALRAGAGAVLDADAGEAQLAAAVAGVVHGLQVMPSQAELGASAAAPEGLTPRELEVLSLLAAGDSNKAIAAALAISAHTVKFHVSSIYAKLNVGSRAEAVALGLRLGIVLL